MKSQLLQRIGTGAVTAEDFHPKVAMARGLLILDENVFFLKAPLESKRFRVRVVQASLKDDQIAGMLAHRIFVTNNADDFRQYAAEEEFSIIDTSKASQEPEGLASMISEAWIRLQLRGKQPFILRLMRNGRHTLEDIE